MSNHIDELKAQEKAAQTEWRSFDGVSDPHDWKESEQQPPSDKPRRKHVYVGFGFPWFILLIPIFFAMTNGTFPIWGLFWLFIFMGPFAMGCGRRSRSR